MHQQHCQKMVCAACKSHPQHSGLHIPLCVPCPQLENICNWRKAFAQGRARWVMQLINTQTPRFKARICSSPYFLMKCSQTAASHRRPAIYETISLSELQRFPTGDGSAGPWLSPLTYSSLSAGSQHSHCQRIHVQPHPKDPSPARCQCLVWEAALQEAGRRLDQILS